MMIIRILIFTNYSFLKESYPVLYSSFFKFYLFILCLLFCLFPFQSSKLQNFETRGMEKMEKERSNALMKFLVLKSQPLHKHDKKGNSRETKLIKRNIGYADLYLLLMWLCFISLM